MLQSLKEWAKEYDPLLRLVEVLLIGVVGTGIVVALTYQQGQSADASVRVAQAAIPPQFTVGLRGGGHGPYVLVACQRPDIRIEGIDHLTLFAEHATKDRARRVAVEDFFALFSDRDTLATPPVEPGMATGTTYYREGLAREKFVLSLPQELLAERGAVRIKCQMLVVFRNALNHRVYQWVVCEPFHVREHAQALEAPLSIDAAVAMKRFPLKGVEGPTEAAQALNPDGAIEFPAFARALFTLLVRG